MKITNHKKGNFYYVDDSVMYGTIEMTQDELLKAHKYLLAKLEVAIYEQETYIRDYIHINQVNEKIDNILSGKTKSVSIGVVATQLIFKLFDMTDKYKRQNYAIKLIK